MRHAHDVLSRADLESSSHISKASSTLPCSRRILSACLPPGTMMEAAAASTLKAKRSKANANIFKRQMIVNNARGFEPEQIGTCSVAHRDSWLSGLGEILLLAPNPNHT